ncbi:hypothetical protein [Gimesia sp.]|uniref:hypothetical protein n=1 Tax=Gimesia sp. TaxID=2024833 RepID=UPI003A934067
MESKVINELGPTDFVGENSDDSLTVKSREIATEIKSDTNSEIHCVSISNYMDSPIATFQCDTVLTGCTVDSITDTGIDEKVTSVRNDSEQQQIFKPFSENESYTLSTDYINSVEDRYVPADPRVITRSMMQLEELHNAVQCCRNREVIARSRVSKSRYMRLAGSISATVGSAGVLASLATTWPAATIFTGSLALIGSLASLGSEHFQNKDDKDSTDLIDLNFQFSDARFQAESLINEFNILLNNYPQNSDEAALVELCKLSKSICKKINKLDARIV